MDKKLKYYDLMEDLRKQIVSGKIKPGEKLPSENELSGREPGIPVQTGQVCVFGAPPNAVEQPQKIFVFVANSTWTSSPMTVSYILLMSIPPFSDYASGLCS